MVVFVVASEEEEEVVVEVEEGLVEGVDPHEVEVDLEMECEEGRIFLIASYYNADIYKLRCLFN